MTAEATAVVSTPEGSWQQFDWLHEDNVTVSMRDGVSLATDVYRPALNGRLLGPFPALMERTPYDKTRPGLVGTAKLIAGP
jgi:predicted acyl esterase